MRKKDEIIVLGLGNVMCGDDGLGVVAAEMLQALEIPGVEVRLAGVDPGAILLALLEARDLVILDCIQSGGKPGQIYQLSPHDLIPDQENPFSLHQLHYSTILKQLGSFGPQRVTILGLEPQTLTWGHPLSQEVQETLPELVSKTTEQISNWQNTTKKAAAQ